MMIRYLFMINVNSWSRSKNEYQLQATAMDIAIEQNKDKKAKTFEELVLQWYHEFKDVFEEATFNMLPEHRPWDHAIELLPNSKPYAG